MLQFGGYLLWLHISRLIGRETINITEIFSGVHGFTGKTVNKFKENCYNEVVTQSSFSIEVLPFNALKLVSCIYLLHVLKLNCIHNITLAHNRMKDYLVEPP